MNTDFFISNDWTVNKSGCEKYAAALNKSDPDWTYEVIYNGHKDDGGRDYCCVQITDEDGELVAQGYWRNMSR